MITLSRVDERLIHGQVAYAWTLAYPSDAIIVIDEPSSKDSFAKSLLEMACPKSLKCFVYDVQNAVNLLNKYPNKKFFLVAKHPKIFLELIEHGIELNKVNIGGLYYQDGRKQYSKTIYLDEYTITILKKLDSLNVYLDGRTTPTDAELNLSLKL